MSTILWNDTSGTWDDGAVSWDGDDLHVTTTGCDHLNEDGGLNLNEDGSISLLESCPATPPTGGGYTAGQDAVARHARLRTIIRDDEELLVLI